MFRIDLLASDVTTNLEFHSEGPGALNAVTARTDNFMRGKLQR